MTISEVGTLPISVFAGDELVWINAEADLWEIATALHASDVGALAMGDGDEVTGIVSERDVVRALAGRLDPATTKADDIAHKRLVWCDVGAPVVTVAEEMMRHYVRHVLLEDAGRPAGMVSARDLLGAYSAADSAGVE
jgi:CBS domain-containing protein